MSEPSRPSRALALLGLRPRSWRTWLAMLAVIGFATAAMLWFLAGRETTDNAIVNGPIHPIAPRVGGPVSKVHVADNQYVEAGDLLFEIDATDYRVAERRASADLAAARSRAQAATSSVPVATAGANSGLEVATAAVQAARAGLDVATQAKVVSEAELEVAQAEIRRSEALHRRAQQQLERLGPLIERDEVSQQDYDDAVASEARTLADSQSAHARLRSAVERVKIADSELTRAEGALTRAEAERRRALTAPEQIAVSEAEALGAEAALEQAAAQAERARLDLSYTRVTAPVGGVISHKRVEVGQILSVGQPVMALVALDEVWVEANFKETQLQRMRPGQRASFRVDAYPDLELEGRVDSLSAATAARFSLLPAENATGNFVKVVQRVPVKIAIERAQEPDRPLRPGMSVVVTVYTRARE